MQGLEGVPEEEAPLLALCIPGVVVQGNVESGAPIRSLLEFRRGPRQVVGEQGRTHVVPRNSLRDRAPELDAALVRHVVYKPVVVERITERLSDVNVREEGRWDIEAVGHRGAVDGLVVAEHGHVERGSVFHDPEGGVAGRSIEIHHVELVVPIDRGGVRVPGQQHELAGHDVVRLLDADLLEGGGNAPVMAEAAQDDHLVRDPGVQLEGACAAIAVAIQDVISDSPVIPSSRALFLDDGSDGERDRLRVKWIRT